MDDEGGDPFDSFDAPEDAEDDPFAHLKDPESEASASSGDPAEESDPFGDLRDREGDPFEQMGGADADADEVWDRLAEGGAGEDPGRATAVVDKSRFCEQCPHFSRPPEAHCTNDGTDIVEFVGIDEVRVSDCPVVAERQALEDISDIHVDPEE